MKMISDLLLVSMCERYHFLMGGTYSVENRNQLRFLGNCPPTPLLSQHFALSEKLVLMLHWLKGGWVGSFSQT